MGQSRVSRLQDDAGRHVGVGSKCEELNLSKSSPPCPNKRTSMRCATTSLLGHERTLVSTLVRSAPARTGSSGASVVVVRVPYGYPYLAGETDKRNAKQNKSNSKQKRYASFVRQTEKRIYKCEDHEKNCNKRACDGPKERMIDQRCSPIECRHVRVKPLNNRLRAVMGRNRRTPVDDAVEACHVKPETAPRMNAGAIA